MQTNIREKHTRDAHALKLRITHSVTHLRLFLPSFLLQTLQPHSLVDHLLYWQPHPFSDSIDWLLACSRGSSFPFQMDTQIEMVAGTALLYQKRKCSTIFFPCLYSPFISTIPQYYYLRVYL